MRLFLFSYILFLLVLPLNTLGGSLSKEILVTNKNAKELGFNLKLDKQVSDPEVWVVSLSFPTAIKTNWSAARVQTYLIDNFENELSSTSFDYAISSGEPRLLFHFQPQINDMAIVVQYFCPDGSGYECAESYTVESIINYFNKDQN